MTTTLLLGPLDFQTFLRPCLVLLYQFPTMPVKWWGNCDRRLASVSTKNKFRLLKIHRLGYCFVLLIFQEIFIFRWNCSDRAVARSENPGGLVVMGGDNVPTLVEIGWIDLPKTGRTKTPPQPPHLGRAWVTNGFKRFENLSFISTIFQKSNIG